MKESFPMQLAEYAVANDLVDESAFRWRVHKVIWRAKWIIKAVKSNKYWLCTHKYGVELPHDRKTGTD